jgi:hypothetical protein
LSRALVIYGGKCQARSPNQESNSYAIFFTPQLYKKDGKSLTNGCTLGVFLSRWALAGGYEALRLLQHWG